MRRTKSKLAHLEACLSPDVEYQKTTGLEAIQLVNQAGVDISLNQISLESVFLTKKLRAPLMIAPMTGGVKEGRQLNQLWARAAEHFGIAFGVGSQRIALENPELADTFDVRSKAPTAFICANLGAAQIAQGLSLDQVQKSIDMVQADALLVHFNAMQEACQKGDVDYQNLSHSMAKLCEHFSKQKFPVLAREVCFGLSPEATRRLLDMGFAGLDCAGAGGTSWAKVEALCASTERQHAMALRFGEWGIPTAQSIQNVRSVSPEIPLVATGGIRSGQDIAKALVLGADVAAMARPMLLAAHQGEEALFQFIEDILTELKITYFAMGKHFCKPLLSKSAITDN